MEGWIMGCTPRQLGPNYKPESPAAVSLCVISGHVIDSVGWFFEFLNELLVG
jgi:hypothetical protein